MHAVVQNVIRSDSFTVLPQPKRLPKAEPPAEILLALSAQGAKLKLRKPNEDRVKRQPDWSINASDAEWAAQTQLMGPPPPPPMSTTMPSMLPPMPMPLAGPGQMMQQQPYHMQPPPGYVPTSMAMENAPYSIGMPAQSQMAYHHQNLLMHTSSTQEIPQDFHFGAFQDPNQIYNFQGAPPSSQHGFGSGYGGF